MRASVRNLLSVVFVAAIAIACSKKAKEQGEQAQPSATVVAQPPPVTEVPPPPPSATETTTTPPVTPPASSIVTAPKTFAPPADPASPSPSDKHKLSKAEKPARPTMKKPSSTSGEEDRKADDSLKSALQDGDLDSKKVAPPPKPVTRPKATTTASPTPPPAPAATASADEKPKDPKDRESQPAATALKHHVSVTTASHYACTTKDHKESVSVASEVRGARITIGGQGPCPGEIKEWIAEVGDKRVDVHGTHGAQSKCTCAGTGDMVLRGLEPGTYDVHVNGGFNRPIAVRVVVGSP